MTAKNLPVTPVDCDGYLINGGSAKAGRSARSARSAVAQRSGQQTEAGGGGAAPAPAAKPDFGSMNATQLRRAAAQAGMKGGARATRSAALQYLNNGQMSLNV